MRKHRDKKRKFCEKKNLQKIHGIFLNKCKAFTKKLRKFIKKSKFEIDCLSRNIKRPKNNYTFSHFSRDVSFAANPDPNRQTKYTFLVYQGL